jgi:hypothetical protein
MSNKLKENSFSSGAVAVAPVKTGVVHKRGKSSKKNNTGKPFMMSTSERMLREAIRKIVAYSKIKFYEDKARTHLAEQKLRGLIKKVLKEEKGPSFDTTGKHYGWSAYNRIFQGMKSSYIKLKTTPEQRKKFLEIFKSVMIDYLDQLDAQRGKPLPKEEEPAEPQTVSAPIAPTDMGAQLEEQEEEVPETPEADPAAVQKQNQDRLKSIAGQTLSTAGAGVSQDPDATGAVEAYSALRTALPQVGEEYEKLSLDSDRKDFRMIIFGDGKTPGTLDLTMAAVEKELEATTPTAPKPEAKPAPAAPAPAEEPAPEEVPPEGEETLAPEEEEVPEEEV